MVRRRREQGKGELPQTNSLLAFTTTLMVSLASSVTLLANVMFVLAMAPVSEP